MSKYENFYLPRIKETKKYQKELYENLYGIKRDSELLPSMFRAEAVLRKEFKKERDLAVEKMTTY